MKYLFIDEEDGMPLDLNGEGSPVDLAKARTRTFGNRKKIFRISTPVYEDTSTINQAYEASSKKSIMCLALIVINLKPLNGRTPMGK